MKTTERKYAEKSNPSPPARAAGSVHRDCSSGESVILENAICDGCGQHHQYVQVVNGAPAANICLCRGCIESAPPNAEASEPPTCGAASVERANGGSLR